MLQPEIEITELPNVTGEQGGQLVFTAEVTVRPEIEIPELSEIEVTVDSVAVTDEDVDTELDNLRARFGSLKSVKRKAKTGDFATIDLVATIDSRPSSTAKRLTPPPASPTRSARATCSRVWTPLCAA